MKKKYIKAIDFVLIIGSVLFLAGFVSYARPLIISPIDNFETTNASVLFEFEGEGVILIDDNLEFSSPQRIYAKDNLVINLKAGKYYWKIDGLVDSEVREFSILSEVNLKLKKIGEKYAIVNAGNVELEVNIYDNKSFTGSVVLDVDDEKEITGTTFVGGMI